MAKSNNVNKDNNEDNPYKSNVKKWVIWTAIVVIIFVILLLVFNRRSTVVNPEGESDSHIGLMISNSGDQHLC